MSLLSIVLPSYNEAENIAPACERLEAILAGEAMPFEILFVDDGSKDATFLKIREMAQSGHPVRGLRFSRNFGKEAAILAGLHAARGDCVVVMDCDMQHPPELIPHMLERWREGYEVVEGVKKDRGHESLFYRLSAGAFYKVISKFANLDMQSSSDYKLLDRKVVDALCALPERSTFFRALSFWVGFRSVSLPYEVAPRLHGTTKWSFFKLLRYAIANVTSFTSTPLQIVTGLGTVLIVCSLILGIQTLVRLAIGNAVEGFTTVILLLLIIGGAIMVSLGIIGHYIAKIYEEVKARPPYIVAQEVEASSPDPQ